MKISIIVPTYNNLKYLKFFLLSIKENSKFEHEIILHINDGSDGTLKYALENKIIHTHSINNIGLCSALNKASQLSTTEHILYAHDDMFFCKNWDVFLKDDVKKYKDNLYYITGTNISANKGLLNYDCGSTPDNFNRKKFNEFCLNHASRDLQGSHWAPHLIHKNLWIEVGGFSEEFNPGDGSDPDLCMKLWIKKVRIFKCLAKFKVYHFSSVTTRKSNILLNNGTRQFLLKYGFNPRFFRKYYLKGEKLTPYEGKLNDPKINFKMFLDLFINRFKYLYYKMIN